MLSKSTLIDLRPFVRRSLKSLLSLLFWTLMKIPCLSHMLLAFQHFLLFDFAKYNIQCIGPQRRTFKIFIDIIMKQKSKAPLDNIFENFLWPIVMKLLHAWENILGRSLMSLNLLNSLIDSYQLSWVCWPYAMMLQSTILFLP